MGEERVQGEGEAVKRPEVAGLELFEALPRLVQSVDGYGRTVLVGNLHHCVDLGGILHFNGPLHISLSCLFVCLEVCQ